MASVKMQTVSVTFRADELEWLGKAVRKPEVRSAMGLKMGDTGMTGKAPARCVAAIERSALAAQCAAAREVADAR